MSRKLFALETCVFCIVVMALRFIFTFLVMLVRCKKKSSLLLKVIPSAFFLLLFLIVTLSDTRSVRSSPLSCTNDTKSRYAPHLSGLRTIKFLFYKTVSWNSKVMIQRGNNFFILSDKFLYFCYHLCYLQACTYEEIKNYHD